MVTVLVSFLKIWSNALEIAWHGKGPFQDLDLCTKVWLGKNLPMLMGTKILLQICSHALEFGWVRLHFDNFNEKGLLQHLESYTGGRLGKTPHFLMGTTMVVSYF